MDSSAPVRWQPPPNLNLAGTIEKQTMTQQQWLTSESPGKMLAHLYSSAHWKTIANTSEEFERKIYWFGKACGMDYITRPGQEQEQCHYLRDIFGNPFQPRIRAEPGEILTPTVVALAQQIYDTGDFEGMGPLHDALVEADCVNKDVLNHCLGLEKCPQCCGYGCDYREQLSGNGYRCEQWFGTRKCKTCQATGWIPLRGPHVRGCWLIDLILNGAKQHG